MGEYAAMDFTKETGWGDYVKSLNQQLVENAKKTAEAEGSTVTRPEAPPEA